MRWRQAGHGRPSTTVFAGAPERKSSGRHWDSLPRSLSPSGDRSFHFTEGKLRRGAVLPRADAPHLASGWVDPGPSSAGCVWSVIWPADPVPSWAGLGTKRNREGLPQGSPLSSGGVLRVAGKQARQASPFLCLHCGARVCTVAPGREPQGRPWGHPSLQTGLSQGPPVCGHRQAVFCLLGFVQAPGHPLFPPAALGVSTGPGWRAEEGSPPGSPRCRPQEPTAHTLGSSHPGLCGAWGPGHPAQSSRPAVSPRAAALGGHAHPPTSSGTRVHPRPPAHVHVCPVGRHTCACVPTTCTCTHTCMDVHTQL